MQENQPFPDATPTTEATDSPVAPDTLTADTPLTTEALTEALRLTEQKAKEHHEDWLRAKAETENVRRRAQEDVSKAHKFASEKFATELLAVKDSLEAAFATENQTLENLMAGVELTLRQLNTAFEKSSVVELNPLNEKFDPHWHQAIGQLDAPEGVEANQVLQVLQKGYALHERVLRPALVMVAKGKA
ncbi:MAG: nucleotide exchange factor GrpE [Sterolibacterium sp.]|nr:nucleotide exchange factor GrpE [Sterolibacterium sp.]